MKCLRALDHGVKGSILIQLGGRKFSILHNQTKACNICLTPLVIQNQDQHG